MTHTNKRKAKKKPTLSLVGLKITKSTAWEIADWLKALNWIPKRRPGPLRVWLRSINGPGDDRALFTVQDRDRLCSIVDAWLDLKRDARALLDARSASLPAADIAQIKNQLQSARAFWAFTKDGGLVPAWLDDTNARPFDVAVALFIRIASDPERWRLTGPCANCEKYFLRERKRRGNKKYCSACRRYESGPRMKAIRKRELGIRLRVARRAVKEWTASGVRGDWKAWVEKRCGKIIRQERLQAKAVTVKALSRWVNSGELKPPRSKGTLREEK